MGLYEVPQTCQTCSTDLISQTVLLSAQLSGERDRAVTTLPHRQLGRPARLSGSGASQQSSPSLHSQQDSDNDLDSSMESASGGAGARRALTASAATPAKSSVVEELDTSQLQPLPNPAAMLPKVIQKLTAANNSKRKELDWMSQYYAITDARRLAVHHREVFAGNLKDFCRAALPAVDELRSLTAKNALMLWQEMLHFLGRQLDPEVERICPVLAKRAGDVSQAGRETFLAQEAGRALQEMLTNCSESRTSTALAACSGHSSKYVRAKVAAAIDSLLRNSKTPPSVTTIERCFNCAVAFVEDQAPEARTYGKRILWAIYSRSPGDFAQLLAKVSNDLKSSKVRDVVAKGSEPPLTSISTQASVGTRRITPRSSPASSPGALHSGTGTPSSSPDSPVNMARSTPQSPDTPARSLSRTNSGGCPPSGAYGRGHGRSASRLSSKSGSKPVDDSRAGADCSELEATLAATARQLDSKNWMERSNALRQVAEVSGQLTHLPEPQVNALIESLTLKLYDPNAKVNMLTLETLETVLPQLGDQASMSLNTLMPALSANVASTNEKIRVKAASLIDTLIGCANIGMLVQNLSHVVATGNHQRSKAVMIEKLDIVVRECYASQPRLVGKHALHAALSSLNDAKTDVRTANAKLLRSLYAAMGPQLLDVKGLSPELSQRLAAIVQ